VGMLLQVGAAIQPVSPAQQASELVDVTRELPEGHTQGLSKRVHG
jgi:hypothetical protein